MKIDVTRMMAMGLLSTMGCAVEHDGTYGELGNATSVVKTEDPGFGVECFSPSCGLEWPLMSGTTEIVSFTPLVGERLPLVQPSSTDGSVLGVSLDLKTFCNRENGNSEKVGDHYDECLAEGGMPIYSQLFTLTGGAEGDAVLELRTKDGGLYERFPIAVRKAARLEVQLRGYTDNGSTSGPEYASVDQITLTATHEYIRAIAFDSDGQRLFATRGLTLEVRDPSIAKFYGEDARIDSFYGELWPMNRGSVALDVRAPTASTSTTILSN
jgi:hypothetical protein